MSDEELTRIEAYLDSLKEGSRLIQIAYALLAEVRRSRRVHTAEIEWDMQKLAKEVAKHLPSVIRMSGGPRNF